VYANEKTIFTLVFHWLLCHSQPEKHTMRMMQGGQGMKRQMVRVWVLVVLAMCCLMPMVHAASVYTDPQGRFSLTIPDGFTQTSSESLPQFASDFPVIAIFNVAVRPTTAGLTLDELTAQLTEQLPDVLGELFDDVRVAPNGSQTTTLGGQSARSLTLIATADDLQLRFTVIYTIAGGDLYVFTYGGLDEDFTAVQREVAPVIASFKFGTVSATSVTPTATIGAVRTPTPQPPPTVRPIASPVPTTPATLTPATITSVPTIQAIPTQPVATGPTGLPEPPFTPRRVGNG